MYGTGYFPGYVPAVGYAQQPAVTAPPIVAGPQVAPPIVLGQQTYAPQMYVGQQPAACPTVQPSNPNIHDPEFRRKIAEIAAEEAVEKLLQNGSEFGESEYSDGWSDQSRGGYGRAEVYQGRPQVKMPARPYAVANNDLNNFQKWIMYRVRGNEGHIDDVFGDQVGRYDMDSRQLAADTRVDALEYARGAEGKTQLDSEYFIRYGIPRVLQRMHDTSGKAKSIVSEASREEMDEFMQWLHWRTARNEAITTGHDVDGNALNQQSRQNALRYTRGGNATSDLNPEAFVQYGLPRLVQKSPDEVVGAPPSEPKQKQKTKKLVKKIRESRVNYDEYLEQAINYALEYYYKNQSYYNQHLADLATNYTGGPLPEIPTQLALPALLPQPALPAPASRVTSAVPVGHVASAVPVGHVTSAVPAAPSVTSQLQSLALGDGQNVTVPVVPAPSNHSIRSASHSVASAKSASSDLVITPPRAASVASSSSHSASSSHSRASNPNIIIKPGIDPPIQPPSYTDLQDEVASEAAPPQSAFLYTTQFPNAEAALTKEYSLQPVGQNFSSKGSAGSERMWRSGSHHSSEVQDILATQ